MTRVFISSTSRDLSSYRRRSLEICKRFDFETVAMEYFESMPMGAVEGSLSKLEQSDLYIGIFAYRYGTIPPGQTKAVTELEFDRAVELGLDRLNFLADPTFPWPPDGIDYENKSKLDQFKQKIERYQIRDLFRSEENFAVKLTDALVAWRETHGMSRTPTPIARRQRVMQVPPDPALLVGRDEDLQQLRKRLEKATSAQRLTIIQGWPGIGKTTLLAALAHDTDIGMLFPDGVLWANIGEQANVYRELKGWASAFDQDSIGLTLEEAVKNVTQLFANKRLLLIADDVWEGEDALPFRKIVGEKSALLVTTRLNKIASILRDLPEDVFPLKQLTDENALKLLQKLCPEVVAQYPRESRHWIETIEGSPLALRTSGRMLYDEFQQHGDVLQIFKDLEEGQLMSQAAPADRGNVSISAIVAQSVSKLDPPDRLRFAQLGTLPSKPATFNLKAIRKQWGDIDPLPMVRKLVDLGLLEPLPTIDRYQMHATLVMYALLLLDDEAALNAPSTRRHNRPMPPPAPTKPGPSAGTSEKSYLGHLYQKLKSLSRQQRQGLNVSRDIEYTRDEIRRLGYDPDQHTDE